VIKLQDEMKKEPGVDPTAISQMEGVRESLRKAGLGERSGNKF